MFSTPHVFDNHNCNAVVSITTVTAVILFNNRVYFKKFLFKKKVYFTYVKVRIVIISSQLTIFCYHALNGIYSLNLFLKFVIQDVPKGTDTF